MALLEAEADAIMQYVTARRGGSSGSHTPAVEINIQEGEDSNEPDSPHVPPPVHGSAAVGGDGGTPDDDDEGQTPMETDKPGTCTGLLLDRQTNMM